MGALGDGRSKSGLDAGLLLLKEGSSLEQDPQLVRKEHQEADQDHEQHIAHVPSNGRAALGLAVRGRQEAKKAGWLLRVRIEDPSELDELISEEEYAELTTEV